jgi:hypothetical protein
VKRKRIFLKKIEFNFKNVRRQEPEVARPTDGLEHFLKLNSIFFKEYSFLRNGSRKHPKKQQSNQLQLAKALSEIKKGAA